MLSFVVDQTGHIGVEIDGHIYSCRSGRNPFKVYGDGTDTYRYRPLMVGEAPVIEVSPGDSSYWKKLPSSDFSIEKPAESTRAILLDRLHKLAEIDLVALQQQIKNLLDDTEYVHLKTGGRYRIICNECLNESTLEPFVVYQNVSTGEVWHRPAKEFFDGRFMKSSQITAGNRTDEG